MRAQSSLAFLLFPFVVLVLDTDAWISGTNEVEEFIGVFADEGLEMVASNVVPFDSVVVEVVQDGKASLVVTLGDFTVVRLSTSESSGVRPVSIGTVVGGSNTGTRARPEPSVDQVGLEISTVAAGEIALSAGSPDVTDTATGNTLLNKVILSWSLDGDGVHTMSSADVTGVQPIDLQVSGWAVLPGEEIVVGHTSGVAP